MIRPLLCQSPGRSGCCRADCDLRPATCDLLGWCSTPYRSATLISHGFIYHSHPRPPHLFLLSSAKQPLFSPFPKTLTSVVHSFTESALYLALLFSFTSSNRTRSFTTRKPSPHQLDQHAFLRSRRFPLCRSRALK